MSFAVRVGFFRKLDLVERSMEFLLVTYGIADVPSASVEQLGPFDSLHYRQRVEVQARFFFSLSDLDRFFNVTLAAPNGVVVDLFVSIDVIVCCASHLVEILLELSDRFRVTDLTVSEKRKLDLASG
jgi:hypothetical protein